MKYSIDKPLDLCSNCVYYHPENKTCNAKKCSGYGNGFVTRNDRKNCKHQVNKEGE